jgi:small subunit ribosomal protein S5
MENKDTKEKEVVAPAGNTPSAAPTAAQAPTRDFREMRRNSPRGGRGSDRQPRERVKPEFDSKIISIRRVTRVASGGRRFSFSVAVVAGDRKGRVGVGLGKSIDTALAIDKATRDAKKHMIKVNLTKTMSIAHPISAKYCSARLMMMPAPGRGVIAGSSVRNVIELAGIKDVVGKLLSGSKNKINNARVAIKALSELKTGSRPISAHNAEAVR